MTVLAIQKRMALLLRFYTINANVCGLPWWIMWVLVIVAFSGFGTVDAAAATPLWIQISLGIGMPACSAPGPGTHGRNAGVVA